jgi:hypothetical protein
MLMSEKVRKAIEKAIAEHRHRDQGRFKRRERIDRIKEDLVRSGAIREAAAKDYAEWLRGFLEQGGFVNQIEDYEMPRRYFYVALKSFVLPADPSVESLFPRDLLMLIVPEGIEIEDRNQDYCAVFPSNYDRHTSDHETLRLFNFHVPLYNDVKEILLSK